jgi:CRISPR system Cascade subunit CasB
MSIVSRIRKYQSDRGFMADLRCGLIPNKKHRAYPALSRVNLNIEDNINALIAGLYATHPKEIDKGNIGETCKTIEYLRDGGHNSDNISPTERRFQNLLASDSFAELSNRLIRIILMAKAQDIAVNYERLEDDVRKFIRYGKDGVFLSWASSFWNNKTAEEK